jgi:hypothetical protein
MTERMQPITTTMSLYDGLLALADAAERDAILAAGPRQSIDNNRVFVGGSEGERACAAYAAIKAILSRTQGDPTFRYTGIDSRSAPPTRAVILTELMLSGRLMWEGPHGERSKLQLNWLHPPIYIIDIYVEPVSHGTVAASLVLAKAPQLQPGERIDDTARLQRMQELIDTGLPTKTAARRTVIEMPSPPSGDDSVVTRLVRKFRNRTKDS